ncbi:hypothetical protein GY45DRAFT_1326093 [Cubamyces sp. BRFM 1775]|nr:hypothetical protein GY45DRAFT_1326093 [Cubamyces sp. BRFM 1775]
MGKRHRRGNSESGSEEESTSDEDSTTEPEVKRRAVNVASEANTAIDFAALPSESLSSRP